MPATTNLCQRTHEHYKTHTYTGQKRNAKRGRLRARNNKKKTERNNNKYAEHLGIYFGILSWKWKGTHCLPVVAERSTGNYSNHIRTGMQIALNR